MIGFWILAATAGLAAIAVIGAALLRGKGDDRATAAFDMQVYRDQLRELDRDVARGVIAEAEAGRAKVEISRRLLEADRKAQAREASGTAPKAATGAALAASAVLILGGGFWAYVDLGAPGYEDMTLESRIAQAREVRETRASQAEAEASLPVWSGPPADAPADYLDLVAKLRAAVADHPDELQGQSLLAQHEGALGNYRAAHAAQQRVIEIKGPSASAEDYAQLADLLVLAAEGYVSPEAEAAISTALTMDPSQPVALYYGGLMNAQIGRPDIAFRIWRDLLERSDPSEPWVQPILSEIGQLAALAGVDYTPPQLEPATSAPSGDAPALAGPTADDMNAAAEMSGEDRAAMVGAMVTRLEDELLSDGGPPERWAQLFKVLGVIGDGDRAKAAWAAAEKAFADDPAGLAQVRAAAAAVGAVE